MNPDFARAAQVVALRELARQVTHDVRSPLTAIGSYAECLAWLPPTDLATRDRYARCIVAETRRLDRMMGYYLALTSEPASAGPLELTDLALALDQVGEELGELAELRGLRLERGPDVTAGSVQWPRGVLVLALTAALESLLLAVANEATLSLRVARSEDSQVQVVCQARCGGPGTVPAHSLAYGAAARLLEAQGGSLDPLAGEPLGVGLRLPRVSAAAVASRRVAS